MAENESSEVPPEVVMVEPLPKGITTNALQSMHETGKVTIAADASGRLSKQPDGWFHMRIPRFDELFRKARLKPPPEAE